MTRVCVVSGNSATVNIGDYDVIVFHANVGADATVPPGPFEFERVLTPNLEDVDRVISYRLKIHDEKISARQSWKDPWPGRKR